MNKLKNNIPNIITISRIISSMCGAVLFLKSNILVSIFCYTYGAFTDTFDGYFARKYNSVTNIGKKLDVVSDKVFSLSLIIPSIIMGNVFIILPLINECIISGINIYSNKKYRKSYTEQIGKIKTIYLFLTLILGLVATKINILFIPFVPLLITTLKYQIKSVDAYLKQFEQIRENVALNNEKMVANKEDIKVNTNNVILNKNIYKAKKLVRKKDYNNDRH